MKKRKSIFQISICMLAIASTLGWASAKNNNKTAIFPAIFDAPAGTDSPAIKAGNFIFISGQGGGSLKNTKNIDAQIEEAFTKLRVVANAAGGNLDDIVKMTVYLADESDYTTLNKVMTNDFKKPYPARSTVVSKLPKNHRIEVDAVMFVNK